MSRTELGRALCLRPYKRFELDYNTASGKNAVCFVHPPNPNEVPIGGADNYMFDAFARQAVPGYSPGLLAGTPCPIGASLLFYIPNISTVVDASGAVTFVYVWSFVYRLRNLADFTHDGRPYSIGKAALGYNNEVVIPAARGSSVYLRREPVAGTTLYGESIQYAWPEGIAIAGNSALPRVGITGSVISQGMYNGFNVPDVFGQNAAFPHWEKANGNDVIVLCQKYNYSQPHDTKQWTPRDWDFQYNVVTGVCNPAAEDFKFSKMFGVGDDGNYQPDTGVYMIAGEPGT
jgi:hypothetical protein